MRARCLSFLVLALLLGGAAGCQSFRERRIKEGSLAELAPQERSAVSAVVAKSIERCVTVRPGFMTIGSGCIVSSDGWILTAEHVVRGRRLVEIELLDGSTHEARVIAMSAGNDFALLKAEVKDLKYFRLGHRPALGDRVIALGTATKWVSPNASVGKVIYPQVRIPGEEGTYYYDAIFHTAPIFPGDSGGPLVDLSGDLVGLHGGFASESASVAPASVEVMSVLPGRGKKKLTLDLFEPTESGGPVVWPAHMPRDFGESSEWTIRSVEDTLAELFAPREAVRNILERTRARFVGLRARDQRRDDELVRAMLADVFAQLADLEERAKTPAPAQTSNANRKPRRRKGAMRPPGAGPRNGGVVGKVRRFHRFRRLRRLGTESAKSA